jgi:histidinol-phosphate phosphatase family protein
VIRPGVLLDRDGTIIADYHYVGVPERVQLIPGAADAIARFNRAGIPVAIITNQSGVARGFYPERNVHLVHEYIMRELALHGAHVDLFLYSPYHPESQLPGYRRFSEDHKPEPGMAARAATALHLDLTKSVVVGDRSEDMQLAGKVGAHGIYLGATPTNFANVPFPSLASAAGYIIERLTGMRQTEFPRIHYTSVFGYFSDYATELSRVAFITRQPALAEAADILVQTYKAGQQVFVAGNGGSASIAEHFTCDHLKGISTDTDWYPQITSLTSNTSLITAVANDIGYDAIFSYQLERQATPHDVLVVFSVSGNSANIVRALQAASELGMVTIAIVARDGGKAAKTAGTTIHIPTFNYGIAEDIMQIVMHTMAQFIRQSVMSPDAIESAVF